MAAAILLAMVVEFPVAHIALCCHAKGLQLVQLNVSMNGGRAVQTGWRVQAWGHAGGWVGRDVLVEGPLCTVCPAPPI